MASMIIILISIVSNAAITEEAVNIDSDTNSNKVHINKLPETLSRLNLQTMIVPNYHGFDMSIMFQSRLRLDPLQSLSRTTDTTETKPIDSQHVAGRRNRRQIDGKIIGEDGESSSVTSFASYSSLSNINVEDVQPVKVENWILQQPNINEMNRIRNPKLGNRRRRLASGSEISSVKNTTASADPMHFNDGHKMSAIKCLLSLSYPVSLPTQCLQYYFGYLYKTIHGN